MCVTTNYSKTSSLVSSYYLKYVTKFGWRTQMNPETDKKYLKSMLVIHYSSMLR